MKLCRIGNIEKEKPAIIDKENNYRDLSSIIDDLNPETINLFNNCYYCDEDNRRGVGFDKPQLEEDGPTCGCVSMNSFGHSGWTGTFAWADPDQEIIYIFLSNRSYPSGETAGKSKLVKENIRSKIQEVIYESIK